MWWKIILSKRDKLGAVSLEQYRLAIDEFYRELIKEIKNSKAKDKSITAENMIPKIENDVAKMTEKQQKQLLLDFQYFYKYLNFLNEVNPSNAESEKYQRLVGFCNQITTYLLQNIVHQQCNIDPKEAPNYQKEFFKDDGDPTKDQAKANIWDKYLEETNRVSLQIEAEYLEQADSLFRKKILTQLQKIVVDDVRLLTSKIKSITHKKADNKKEATLKDLKVKLSDLNQSISNTKKVSIVKAQDFETCFNEYETIIKEAKTNLNELNKKRNVFSRIQEQLSNSFKKFFGVGNLSTTATLKKITERGDTFFKKKKRIIDKYPAEDKKPNRKP